MKDEFKYVVHNSKYVSIDYGKVNQFINELGNPNMNIGVKNLI